MWSAALVRLLALPFAEDMWGDAPVRVELVQRWVQSPGLFWDYAHVFQYGPLPTNVAGALSVFLGWWWGTRLVVLSAGVCSVWLAMRVGRRLGGEGAGLAAGWALALAPLHIQASTTFASEALFVAFALGCLDRMLARDPWGLAAWAFAATTTRWDAWLWLPAVGLWWVLFAQDRRRAFGEAALLGLGPLSILLANLVAGDALAPLRHVSEEHVHLAAATQARWGLAPWRVAMALWWPFALLVTLTPGFGVWVMFSIVETVRGRWREARLRAGVMGLGLAAPVVYATRAVVFGTFWPMVRFASGPAAMFAVAMRSPSRRVLGACIALALAFDVGLLLVVEGSGRWGRRLEPYTPVSRIRDDLREGARVLREARCDDVVLDRATSYEDIVIAFHAGCDRFALRSNDGAPPGLIIAVKGAPLDAALDEGQTALGASYVKAGERGRVSWWRRR